MRTFQNSDRKVSQCFSITRSRIVSLPLQKWMWSIKKKKLAFQNKFQKGSIGCHYPGHTEQHLSHWAALSAQKKKGALFHVCCHCWSSVIRSNFNHTIQPHWFQFTTDCVEWNIVLFFFLHQWQLPNNESSISQCIRRHGVCEILGLGYLSTAASIWM